MKTLTIVRWLSVLFLLATTVAVQAGDFTYTTNADNTITITGYHGSGAVDIPSVIEGKTVTIIGLNAFLWRSDLTSVTIPDSVTNIGNQAFAATSLTSVTIPDSVASIGEGAFASCTNLTAITVDVENSIYSSVAGVLFDKSQTTFIEYPGGIDGSYTIPNSVTSIGNQAFKSCIGLTSVTIPASVTNIGDFAFVSCTSLTSVYFEGNAPSIGLSVFGMFGVYDNAIIYYLAGATGWGTTFGDLPTALWLVQAAITVDPQSRTNNPGSSASFTVAASGTVPLYYQWQKDVSPIALATNATYTINPVEAGNAGNYRCIVSNMVNAVTSAVAVLTVNAVTPPNPLPSVPTGLSASDGTYTNKIVVTWNAASDATGYQVWRSISNNITISSNLVTTANTTYDDLTAATTPGTILYYWVKAVNATGASGFSTNDSGYVQPAIGPTIKANGTVGNVTVNYPDAMSITVEMNADNYAGVPVDWWVVACANGTWFYLNSTAGWTQEGDWHPVCQGGLFDLPATEVLNITGLGTGLYTFWFAVDYPMDGILNLDGPILVDAVNVTVQ